MLLDTFIYRAHLCHVIPRDTAEHAQCILSTGCTIGCWANQHVAAAPRQAPGEEAIGNGIIGTTLFKELIAGLY